MVHPAAQWAAGCNLFDGRAHRRAGTSRLALNDTPMRLPSALSVFATRLIHQLPGTLRGGSRGEVLAKPMEVRNDLATGTRLTSPLTRQPALTRQSSAECKARLVALQLKQIANPPARESAAPSLQQLRDEARSAVKELHPKALTARIQQATRLQAGIKAQGLPPPRLRELHPLALMKALSLTAPAAPEPRPAPSQSPGTEPALSVLAESRWVDTHDFFGDADTLQALRPGLARIDQLVETVNPLASYLVPRSSPARLEHDTTPASSPALSRSDSIDGDSDYDTAESSFDAFDSPDAGVSEPPSPPVQFTERGEALAKALGLAFGQWKAAQAAVPEPIDTPRQHFAYRAKDDRPTGAQPPTQDLLQQIRAMQGAKGLKRIAEGSDAVPSKDAVVVGKASGLTSLFGSSFQASLDKHFADSDSDADSGIGDVIHPNTATGMDSEWD